jgi:hypothetical protein
MVVVLMTSNTTSAKEMNFNIKKILFHKHVSVDLGDPEQLLLHMWHHSMCYSGKCQSTVNAENDLKVTD